MMPAVDDEFYWRNYQLAWSEAFRIQLGISLKELNTSGTQSSVGNPEVGARLEFATDLVQVGELRCYFSNATVMAMYAAATGEADASGGLDSLSAAGELLNLTYGSARTKINGTLSHSLLLPARPILVDAAQSPLRPEGRYYFSHYGSDLGNIRFELYLLKQKEAA